MPFSKKGGECGNGGGLLNYASPEDLRDLKSRTWTLTEWKRRDAYLRRESGRTIYSSGPTPGLSEEVVPGGWDHDHCNICWWELNEFGDPDAASGFSDGDHGWLCCKCHASLIRWNG